MNIALVYPAPDVVKPCRFGYSLLLLYLGETLTNAGHKVVLKDFSHDKYSAENLVDFCLGIDVLILELDSFPLKRSKNLSNAEQIANDCKTIYPRIRLIACGKYCSLVRRAISFVDLTICGDPEFLINKIVAEQNCKQFIDVGVLQSLDSLPMPKYDLLPKELMLWNGKIPSGLMETSRGCPGCCSFCQRKGWRKSTSYRSINDVEKNFKILQRSGVRNLWIVDENFTGNLENAKRILRKITLLNRTDPIKIALSSWVHIDIEFLVLAKKAGVSVISFGIETTNEKSQTYYRKIIDKNNAATLFREADNLGIFTVGNFIVGSPFDTIQTILADMKWAIDSSLDNVNVKILDYMLGSELYDRFRFSNADHVFASREIGMANYSLNELRNIAKMFRMQFSHSRTRKIADKISKYGAPYYT